MPQIDVIAVVGPRAPERLRCAKRLAERTQRAFVPATRLLASDDPIEEALLLALWSTPSSGAVIEFPGTASVVDLIGALTDPSAPTRLLAVVCVADAPHLADGLADERYVADPLPDGGAEHTARAWLAATQLEYATTIVLANADRVGPAEREDLLGLIGLIAPAACLHVADAHSPAPVPIDAAPVSALQDRAGWALALSGDAVRPARGRASAFRYENVRPLHPWRLHLLLEHRFGAGEFGSIVRSAGFCRLASRPGIVAQWEQVGSMFDLVPVAEAATLHDEDELLTLGQDLYIAGIGVDHHALTDALDDVALTDAELLGGVEEWRGYPDPFPDWLVPEDSER